MASAIKYNSRTDLHKQVLNGIIFTAIIVEDNQSIDTLPVIAPNILCVLLNNHTILNYLKQCLLFFGKLSAFALSKIIVKFEGIY